MSDYAITTDFAAKDSLSPGDTNKLLKGVEVSAEFQAIRTAVNSKADIASPTFTGTPAGPTATSGTSTTQLATTAFVTTALQALYPVGSIYINSSVSTNPGTLLGFGTWTAFAAGRVLVGFNASNTLFDTAEETGGSADAVLVSHTHTDSGHTHTMTSGGYLSPTSGYRYSDTANTNTSNLTSQTTASGTANLSTEGVSATNANYQPYITVYMWKRTA